jgi:inward rectifier potassium channel
MSGTDGPLASLPAPRARRRWGQQKSTLVNLGNYSLRKRGVSRYDWADPYGLAVSLTWPQFLALLSTVYLAVNVLFAFLYFAVPGVVANARPGAFSDDFFFSFETLATVGYGEMYPVTYYGHIVACVEIMCGIAFTAILTGLTFVRFSKPRPKYVFADNPVVAMHNGVPTLMLRIGNGGASVLADAKAKISILLAEQSAEGTRFRRAHELRLARSVIPVFPLSWTLMHEIDKASPLFGLDADGFEKADARLFISFEARDPQLATIIHDLRNYGPEAVRFGWRYIDIISEDEEGRPTADIDRISEVEPDEGVFVSLAPI